MKPKVQSQVKIWTVSGLFWAQNIYPWLGACFSGLWDIYDTFQSPYFPMYLLSSLFIPKFSLSLLIAPSVVSCHKHLWIVYAFKYFLKMLPRRLHHPWESSEGEGGKTMANFWINPLEKHQIGKTQNHDYLRIRSILPPLVPWMWSHIPTAASEQDRVNENPIMSFLNQNLAHFI